MKGVFLSLFLLLLIILMPLVTHADEITVAQTVQASQTAVYHFELHNETAVPHAYNLALHGLPNDLTASFNQGGPILDQVDVAANSHELVEMQVAVPAEAVVAPYRAQFTAIRDDGQILTQSVTLKVENIYAVKIASQTLNVSAFSGQEFGFEVTAVNNGAATINNLALLVAAPDKWLVQTIPSVVPALEPGTETTLHAQVLIPPSQVPSDQTLELTLSSDQTSSPTGSLKVRVQSSPTFLYTALGLMGVAIIIAVVYFQGKGRR